MLRKWRGNNGIILLGENYIAMPRVPNYKLFWYLQNHDWFLKKSTNTLFLELWLMIHFIDMWTIEMSCEYFWNANL